MSSIRVSFKKVYDLYPSQNYNITGISSVWKQGFGWHKLSNFTNCSVEDVMEKIHAMYKEGWGAAQLIIVNKRSKQVTYSDYNISSLIIK